MRGEPSRPGRAVQDRFEYFLEAVGEGLGKLDDEEIRRILFRRLREASGARRGCLVLYDLYEKLRLEEESGLFEGKSASLPDALAARLESLIQQMDGLAPVESEDPWEGVGRSEPWSGRGLWVPIGSRGRLLGLAWLEDFPGGEFPDASQRKLVAAFALHLGACLGAAQVYREHEKKKSRIEKLNKILETKVQTQTLKIRQMATEIASLSREFQLKYNYERIVGKSAKMREVLAILDKVVDSEIPVLILGESGTGKELIAKAVHFNSKRKERPFVSENCAAIGESLFESELFGYEKGAFTGASETKAGLFEVADLGTIFLDEVGDLNPENQKKLLRVLQEKQIRRVGGKTPIPIDVRVVSATNRSLDEMIEAGTFREDLYYRLKVVTIRLPPMRDRVEDIPLLIDHFLKEFAAERDEKPLAITSETLRAFLSYSWPGNVRELENEVRRLVIMGEKDFRPGATSSVRRYSASSAFALPPGLSLEEAVELYERQLLLQALEANEGNKSKAARDLKIGRMKLHRMLERLGIADTAEDS